jgi:hypothetical protein
LHFTGGGASGAAFGRAVTNASGVITSVTLSWGGAGYTSEPTVAVYDNGSLSAGSGATFISTIGTGKVGHVYLLTKGSGFTSNPSVGFSGGGGSSAAATATIYVPAMINNYARVPAVKSMYDIPLVWELSDATVHAGFGMSDAGATEINATDGCTFTTSGTDIGGIGTASGASVSGTYGAFVGAFHHTIQDVTLVNGANENVAINATASILRIVGPTAAFSIGGIAGGTAGRALEIVNDTAFNMQILDMSAGSSAANKIFTMAAGDSTGHTTNLRGYEKLVYFGAFAGGHAGGPGWVLLSSGG